MIKKFIEGWIEAFKYYQASDKDRHKITAKYNKRFKELSEEGYTKRESDDFETQLVGIRTCVRLWDETAAYDKMIARVATIEFWDTGRKELVRQIKADVKKAKKNP